MTCFRNILVFQPAAIGDVMFATPVAKILKSNFPEAHVVWWTHSSTKGLLQLCPYIDEVIDYQKQDGIFAQRKKLHKLNPDLVIDLVGSTRAHMLTLFSKACVLHLHKDKIGKHSKHIVDNMLATLAPLVLKIKSNPYPTLEVDPNAFPKIVNVIKANNQHLMIALVPCVGTLRLNRAWEIKRWYELAQKILLEGLWQQGWARISELTCQRFLQE